MNAVDFTDVYLPRENLWDHCNRHQNEQQVCINEWLTVLGLWLTNDSLYMYYDSLYKSWLTVMTHSIRDTDMFVLLAGTSPQPHRYVYFHSTIA